MESPCYDFHVNESGDLQCYADGRYGQYVIRKMSPDHWSAIQLFGMVGCIAGEGYTPELAFEKAEREN